MSKNLSKQECLDLDVEVYNMAMDIQYPAHKAKMNLNGEMNCCEHCERKYIICCICDTATQRWDSMIDEVQKVSERDRSGEF